MEPRTGPAPVVVTLTRYAHDEEEEIRGDEIDPFQGPPEVSEWMPGTQHVGLRSGDDLIGHVGLVESRALIGGIELPVVGFGGVIVARSWRGLGLARQLMTAATAAARGIGPDVGLLFCRDDRTGFYAKVGWTAVPASTPVVVPQSRGDVVMPMRTMWLRLHGRGGWPAGSVRLLSLPM